MGPDPDKGWEFVAGRCREEGTLTWEFVDPLETEVCLRGIVLEFIAVVVFVGMDDRGPVCGVGATGRAGAG